MQLRTAIMEQKLDSSAEGRAIRREAQGPCGKGGLRHRCGRRRAAVADGRALPADNVPATTPELDRDRRRGERRRRQWRAGAETAQEDQE
eukprot:scaffold15366_cov70-Phaeocystis_antarctica.AAC.1